MIFFFIRNGHHVHREGRALLLESNVDQDGIRRIR